MADTLCATCGAIQEKEYYRFCDGICQKTYIEIKEKRTKSMKHTYLASQLNPAICATCNRDYLAHTKAAQCESCDRKDECNLVNDILMCHECEASNLIVEKDKLAEQTRSAEEIISEARKIDSSIRFNGDFFNAKTVSFAELRKSINEDDTIESNQKQLYFQTTLADRYKHLKDHVFELDEKKHQAIIEQQVIAKTLRELGQELRDEIRDKIKELDASYQPVKAKAVKAKLSKRSKSPIDRIIENVALAKGISKEEAKKIVMEKGLG